MPPPIRRLDSGPVAGFVVEALAASCEEIAKGWLLAMIEDAPFSDAAGLLRGPVIQDGVRLCHAVIDALGSDAALAELGGVAAVTWETAASSVGAFGALRRVLWAAIVSELSATGEPPGGVATRLTDFADRLGIVLDEVLRASVAASGRGPGPGVGASPAAPGPESERAPAAVWPAPLEYAIDATAGPLSLIAVILDDAERMLGVETRGDASAIWDEFRGVLTESVGLDGAVICEAPGPAWVICGGATRRVARLISTRIAVSVAKVQWRGAPVTVSSGIATMGEDGDNAAALIEAAESAALAAAAGAIEISRPPVTY